jgi:hypothetical protein
MEYLSTLYLNSFEKLYLNLRGNESGGDYEIFRFMFTISRFLFI